MSEIKSAFPYFYEVKDRTFLSGGMTLRDYFAGQALLATINISEPTRAADEVATMAYWLADAMMEARDA